MITAEDGTTAEGAESTKGFCFSQPFDGGILHEQYWWPFYKNFVPDIYERYATAFRFALDRGYQPIWIEDGFFAGAE